MTGGLVTVMRRAIPSKADCSGVNCADFVLCLWILTEAGRRLYTSPLTLFEAPIFHPFRHALAYSESMLSGAAVVGPLGWLTGNPVLAYDLCYLGSIVLSVVGMFLLVREITADARAGLVAGALFGLATERQLFWGFVPALAVHWAPFLVLAWLRFLDRPSGRRGVALALALLAHMHAGAYHGLMLPMLLGPWALVLAAFGAWPIRRWLLCAVPLGIGGALGAALYYPYEVVRQELQYVPSGFAIMLPSQYADGLLHPLAYAASRFGEPPGDFAVSPLAWWILAAAMVAVVVRRRALAPGPRGLRAQLAAALLLTLLAMAVSIGVVIMTPRGLVPGPLALLQLLPGFAAMRAPVRFMVLAAFGRALVAGIATTIVLRRLPGRAAGAAVLAVVALALVDARLGDPRPVHDVTVPPQWARGYAWLRGTVPGTAIVEVPYGYYGDDARYMWYALSHGRRLMNGYSAAMPRVQDVVARLPRPEALRALEQAGVSFILVHPSLFRGNPLLEAQLAGLMRRRDLVVTTLDDTIVMNVPQSPRPPEPPLDDPLPRDGWTVEASTPGAEAAIDGDVETHWRANSMSEDQYLRLDLGAERRVAAVVLDLGMHVLEYPRQYELRASRDRLIWDVIGQESVTVPPFASYRIDHRHVTLRLRTVPTVARFLELRVPAYPRNAWAYCDGAWGIHELLVFGRRLRSQSP
jgi:hypothetical protein